MNKATKAFIAGAAGIALLAGGSTFALWSEAATVQGGSISAGSFKFITSGTSKWVDTSDATTIVTDGTGKLNFLAVPGDVLKFTQPTTITATGTNLTAQLSAISDLAQADMTSNGITVKYSMYSGSDTTIAAKRVVQPTSLGSAATAVPIPASATAGDTYTIVLDVAFASSAPINLQGVLTQLGGITFTMNQVAA